LKILPRAPRVSNSKMLDRNEVEGFDLRDLELNHLKRFNDDSTILSTMSAFFSLPTGVNYVTSVLLAFMMPLTFLRESP
jgi:hypothetical protein